MNASPKEIVFTSGATESDNLAILGVARLFGQKEKGRHVITAPTEHSAVLDCCRQLEREGFEVTYLAPEKTGEILPESVREAITEKTVLVTPDARQQRDRHDPADRRDRRDLPGEGRFLPHRRGAGFRQAPVRRRGDERGSRLDLGPQDLRAQGRGRALRPRRATLASASSRSSSEAATSAACARER